MILTGVEHVGERDETGDSLQDRRQRLDGVEHARQRHQQHERPHENTSARSPYWSVNPTTNRGDGPAEQQQEARRWGRSTTPAEVGDTAKNTTPTAPMTVTDTPVLPAVRRRRSCSASLRSVSGGDQG